MTEREIINHLPSLISLAPLFLAFSVSVRKEIGKRDNWTCQQPGCDKSFQTGWMVQAAHDPEHHLKSDPLYNSPGVGSIRCIEHHLAQHLEGTTLPDHQNNYAIRQLQNTEPHTRWWLESKK